MRTEGIPTFKIIVFDTSGINALKNDREREILMAGVRNGYYARLTFYNVHEVAATPGMSDRSKLLDVCRDLLRNGECLHNPQAIICALINDYEEHGGSNWNGDIRLEEYERIITEGVASDAGADEQRRSAEKVEQEFRSVFGELRPEFEKLFGGGSERPKDFDGWLELLTPPGGAFWDYAARLYRVGAGYLPGETKMRAFVAACPPVNAVVHSLLLAQFERSVRKLGAGPSYRAGHVDLFSAAYLPYCDVFVTNDQRQERCLREIVKAAKIATEIRSYTEFREGLSSRLRTSKHGD